MQRFFFKLLPLITLVLLVTWAGKGIFKYSVFSTHDGNHHLARSFDAIQTISEGHFPLRWAGSLNYNCGAPIYNFFYPLIYYLVVVINLFVNNVILSLKIIDFFSLILGTIFFYLWIKSETKKEIPALGGAILYLYVPYRFLLIFVRGSPEFLAYAILPLVLYLYSLVFNTKGKKALLIAFLAAISGGLLTISHNFTVMFLMPFILLYLVLKIVTLRVDKRKILILMTSFVSSFGFGAFFIGPAIIEKKFTKIGHNFLMWRDHFPTLGQLIKSKWDYFYSSAGTYHDGMSFMLGYAHWVVLGIALLFIIFRLFKKKFDLWIIIFFVGSLLTLYLILPWSVPLWEKLPPLQEIQFSWRLLGIAVFTISALFAFILDKIESKYILVFVFVGVSFLALYGNRNHLLPQPVSEEDIYRYDDFERLHPHRYSTTTLGDDVLSKEAKISCWFTTPAISQDDGEKMSYELVERKNTQGALKVSNNKKETKEKRVILGLGYFPGIYKIFINGDNLGDYSDCGGTICFSADKLREGENFVSWKIVQSPTQYLFNYITLGFLIFWLIILFINKRLIFILVVFAIFAFFRFYNLEHRIGFGWDHERDAWAISEILSGDLKLIGPRVIGAEGFFLPPYFFYLLTPFYFLTRLHPDAIFYFLITYSILFFITSLLVLKRIFNLKVALIFLVLWAVNPFALRMDAGTWNPTPIPLAFIFIIFLLSRYYQTKKWIYPLLLGAILGLGISFHFQFALIAPILIPFLGRGIKNWLVTLGGLVSSFTPIILFDLKYKFLNLKLFAEFIRDGGDKSATAFINVWETVSTLILGINPNLIIAGAMYFLILFLLRLGYKKLKGFLSKLFLGLSLAWVFFPVAFTLYGVRPSEYYLNYLLPIIILTVSYWTSQKKILLLLVVLIVIAWGVKSTELLKEDPLGLYYKKEAVSFISQVTRQSTPFNISFDTPLTEDAGFRYILSYDEVAFSNNPKDPLFEIVIPHKKRKDVFYRTGLIGVHIPDGWLKENWP